MRLRIPHTYIKGYHKALRVIAYMTSPVATIGDPIHLDGLVAGNFSGQKKPRKPGRTLQRLRFAKCGVMKDSKTIWWWAASAHYGKVINYDTAHIHRQFPMDRTYLLRKDVRRINVSTGRTRLFRIPLPTLLYKKLTWFCIADREWLWEQLKTVQYIGKKHNRGFGEVLRWEIEEVHVDDCFFNFRLDGSPARCLPYIWRPQLGYPIPATIRPSYWDERNMVECLIPDYDV